GPEPPTPPGAVAPRRRCARRPSPPRLAPAVQLGLAARLRHSARARRRFAAPTPRKAVPTAAPSRETRPARRAGRRAYGYSATARPLGPRPAVAPGSAAKPAWERCAVPRHAIAAPSTAPHRTGAATAWPDLPHSDVRSAHRPAPKVLHCPGGRELRKE